MNKIANSQFSALTYINREENRCFLKSDFFFFYIIHTPAGGCVWLPEKLRNCENGRFLEGVALRTMLISLRSSFDSCPFVVSNANKQTQPKRDFVRITRAQHEREMAELFRFAFIPSYVNR
jgi:hypothetical protein